MPWVSASLWCPRAAMPLARAGPSNVSPSTSTLASRASPRCPRLHQGPIFERQLVEDGMLLRNYWFSVGDAEQEARFRSRLEDPIRRWKLAPMDLESITRW